MAYGLAPSDTYAARDPLINFMRQELSSVGLETEALADLLRSNRRWRRRLGPVGLVLDLPRVESEEEGQEQGDDLARARHRSRHQERWAVGDRRGAREPRCA